jgi:hypothetical protein
MVFPAGLETVFYCPNSTDSTNLKGQVPVFISPRKQVALGAGFLFVASYNSQGYGGGILTCLHMGIVRLQVKFKVMLRLTVSQSVGLGVKFTLGLMTRYYFCLKFAVLSLWGAPSDERSGLSPVSLFSSI